MLNSLAALTETETLEAAAGKDGCRGLRAKQPTRLREAGAESRADDTRSDAEKRASFAGMRRAELRRGAPPPRAAPGVRQSY